MMPALLRPLLHRVRHLAHTVTRQVGATCVIACVIPAAAAAEPSPRSSWGTGTHASASFQGGVEPDDSVTCSDGLYGRLDGDLAVGLGGGPEYSSAGHGFAAYATTHYYYTAGLALGYARAFEGRPPRNRLSAGVDLRPLFLPRWSQDWEQGPAWLDLAIDSLALGLAGFYDWGPRGRSGSSVGLEGSVGLGVPLTKRATGPWLEWRGLHRWPLGSNDATPVDWSLWLGLSWHAILETALVSETSD